MALGDYQETQCQACIGGTNVQEDMHRLQNGVHVVVGTPGRVFDVINRRALSRFHIVFPRLPTPASQYAVEAVKAEQSNSYG